jgi:EAL domain-containing protein (putative c-di-GMP-specific phosphodiesterase class I)
MFSNEELAGLLRFARKNNAKEDITGMLLYSEGSFFQVLEGEEEKIRHLFRTIEKDKRHHSITIVIQEPIAERSFADWTMGYVYIKPEDVDKIIGANDFLLGEQTFTKLGRGRAKKLLAAFKHGHWRAKISDFDTPVAKSFRIGQEFPAYSPAVAKELLSNDTYSFAFQLILDVKKRQIFSYEALLRGRNNESAQHVLNSVPNSEIGYLDDQSRIFAINLAAQLGLSTHLNLNIIPSTAISSPTTIASILRAAEQSQIRPEQIVLEILESEIIENFGMFTDAIREYRGSGLLFAIDDFGAGYAGLNLLAEFQPHIIKLDLQLIRNVHSKGPRQAIIRGLMRTCFDLGIDIIAEGVETESEYYWLRDEGIDLFQGFLFAKPEFESLSTNFYIPD